MKLTIPLKGDLSVVSKDDNHWYQVEVEEAEKLGINLNNYHAGAVTCCMAERGFNPKPTTMTNVDAYELELIKMN